MTRAGVTPAMIESMWKAYKEHQSAFSVARAAKVSPHTAQKYIDSGNFQVRFSKLKIKAIEKADDAQADLLANDLIALGNIKTMISDAILAKLKKGTLKPTINELDKIIRLIVLIRGEPDERTEEYWDFSWIEEPDETLEVDGARI